MLAKILKAIIVIPLSILGLFLVIYAAQKVYDYAGYKNKSFLEAHMENVNKYAKPIDITAKMSSQESQNKNLSFFGTPSEYAGKVEIEFVSNMDNNSPAKEYVTLYANPENKEPVRITSWTLQSLKSNIRVPLPDAVEDLKLHGISATYPVYLLPGQQAIINTGYSPLGISFVENKCTGYLNAFQSFIPKLKYACPSALELAEFDEFKLLTLGGSCYEMTKAIPNCSYVTDQLASQYGVTQACLDYLKPRLTYSFCREKFKKSPDYFKNASWRLFLNMQQSLWDDNSDIIRLLDEYGRVVDVYEY